MRTSLAFVLFAAACSNDIPIDNTPPSPPGTPDIPDTGFHMSLTSLDAFSYTVKLEAGLGYFDEIIDTGSSTTAIASSKCGTCGMNPVYTPGDSATDKNMTAMTVYADNSMWSGEIYTEKDSWLRGPFVSTDLVAITGQTGFFDPMAPYSGILGLGPKQLLEAGTSSYMDGLAAQYDKTELMAFRLCPFSGDMWLQGYDPTAAAADPQWTPMLPIDDQNNPFYSVNIAGVALGTTDLAVTTADFGPVLIDTGTSVSYIPDPALNKLLAAINADATFKTLFPAQTLADNFTNGCVQGDPALTSNDVDSMLPTLSVSYPDGAGGSFPIEVPASQSYLYPVGMGQFCLAVSSAGPDATYGSLIGDTLLAGMLTIFDVQNLQVGLAPQAGCEPFDPLPTSPRSRRVVTQNDRPWFRSSPYFRGRPARTIRVAH